MNAALCHSCHVSLTPKPLTLFLSQDHYDRTCRCSACHLQGTPRHTIHTDSQGTASTGCICLYLMRVLIMELTDESFPEPCDFGPGSTFQNRNVSSPAHCEQTSQPALGTALQITAWRTVSLSSLVGEPYMQTLLALVFTYALPSNCRRSDMLLHWCLSLATHLPL